MSIFKIALNCKSLTAYNFCSECARDLTSFPVDQKYELINENDKKMKMKTQYDYGFF